ncbi:MAG TPA: RsmE family RNA methyltransferase [Thermoanaerobaculia bacterium]|jgi:16S rRNA (uracil1498-N3)-methyltransferase|nr:RsmE family RNA methyltransferase [Thermoanaerobaculia bacterium]
MNHRFFFEQDLVEGATVALQGDERHHARVLRLRASEAVELFDGRGANWLARFESEDALHIVGRAPDRERKGAVHLAMAIIQLDRFEFVLQKVTELGAASIVPLRTERTEVRPERWKGKTARWEKIVFEAVKQSGRSRIPPIEPPADFEAVIARPGTKIVFDADVEPDTGESPAPTTLFIGPEGGWSEREIVLARNSNARFERLGPRRLRAETAAIVALARQPA